MAMVSSEETKDTAPLVAERDGPPVSSRTGVPLDKTVRAMLDSADPEKHDLGLGFIRKILSLLVLQYTAVLMIVSPFCLLDTFKTAIRPFVIPLSIVSFFGIVWSVSLVITKGHEKWYARTSLFCTTAFFALALGLKLSMVPWANYALVALGQAVANFAILHAVVQFDSNSLYWLTPHTAFLLLLALALLWICILRETGASWLVATTVPLGGWIYAVSIIMSIRKTTFHREPKDYLRATIFILGPPVPDFLIPKKRQTSGWSRLRIAHRFARSGKKPTGAPPTSAEEETSNDNQASEKTSYGGLDDSATAAV